MYTYKKIMLLLTTLVFSVSCLAGATITKRSGGSIKTKLGYDIVINRNSSLEREWITIHDDSIPADITSHTGVRTTYERGDRSSSGKYRYLAVSSIMAKEPLTAIELRFLTFNIWGDHIRNLSATEIVDMTPGVRESLKWKWNIYSENEVSQYYASIAYIAQVRTKTGRVIKADPRIVLEQARLFSKGITEDDLDPKPERE